MKKRTIRRLHERFPACVNESGRTTKIGLIRLQQLDHFEAAMGKPARNASGLHDSGASTLTVPLKPGRRWPWPAANYGKYEKYVFSRALELALIDQKAKTCQHKR